ncbi:MAG: exonuclease SbcCD subunit D, partial [Duncaniella sp.]|nr:exonuclease SbcCD subunit D [Duncaniella sp.]
MKILHTSDWHLGHQLYGFDRTEEQQDMLNQITRIVTEERPDVFLLCGDVFHVSNPSAAVQKMLVDTVVSLRDANPSMKIIVIAGNHDSGVRHEIFRSPWSSMGVEFLGVLRPENPEEHILEIEGKGWVVAVPYANERFISDGFFEDLLNKVEERNSANLPVVMMAHTTVCGADFSGHERPEQSFIGGIEGVEVGRFGSGYDYLALGHIHREQFIHTGRHNVRYSGTPLAVSFDETFNHSVSIVEIGSHGERP